MTDGEKTELINKLVAHALLNNMNIGEALLSCGIEPRDKAKWLRDASYTGVSKDIYICSACLHWQSVKKHKPMYMRYCPHCGARMEVNDLELP